MGGADATRAGAFDYVERNVADVRGRIARAAKRAGRAAREITLIAVSKNHPSAAIAAAYAAGVRDFGENKVQEAGPKIVAAQAQGLDVRWHMIGHLQRNKVPAALERFDILQTVDTDALARAIDVRATRRVPVLIEVNVSGEETKHGVPLASAKALAVLAGGFPNIDLRGLMTVAPHVDSPEDVRRIFRQLRKLRDGLGLRELSMGMTDDFEVAIEEGSTLVRVGRAIFGERGA